uniref:Uncharacterized protein n=1 Tax=uncultured Chloroflexota bacterium TaxID=166587 RepID=H5SIB0_9CHLR|nr:hypothetical protein HGMM_F07B11C10 [uncultured Chloroflexota bacterium]BAL55896.1 hypothetical protein HGMM_F32G01C06 [uncultured Chloroflexota bacterium]
MSNKSPLSIEQLEARLPRWEKWLYLTLGAALIMLLHGLIKYEENTLLADLLSSLEEQGVDISQFMLQSPYWLSTAFRNCVPNSPGSPSADFHELCQFFFA